jgi:hypothetical protein
MERTHFENGMNAFPDADYRGMTLRDYFAAQALPTAVQINTMQYNMEFKKEWYWDDDEDAAFAASVAYRLADAMLKERESK